MLWLVFAFLTAVFEALKDGFCKKSVKDLDYIYVAWAWKAFSLIFLGPYLIFLPTSVLSLKFVYALIAGGTLNIIATLLYIKAIKVSDLSSTLPMLSFSTLFLLFTSPVMVGDVPDISGIIGVCLIFLGSFILTKTINNKKSTSSYRGPIYMLGVAFVWSIAANIDKIGINASSIFVWAVCVQTFIVFGLTLILFIQKGFKKIITVSSQNLLSFFLIGLFTAIGLSCQFFAITKGLVPYVISIKRLSIVFGVLIGGMFFKETHLKLRLLASVIMFAGIVFIVV